MSNQQADMRQHEQEMREAFAAGMLKVAEKSVKAVFKNREGKLFYSPNLKAIVNSVLEGKS